MRMQSMTKVIADENCEACGSVLIPPQLASGFKIPAKTDYVYLKCGRPYRWVGNSPRLATVFSITTEEDDD
jgi:hypothetical protein